MAWSSYNFFLNNSSPSYGLGWDTTGYTWPQVSPTDSFPVPLTAEPSSMSPNHLLYNHHLQHPSAPLDPKFFMPATSSNLDIYNPNQDAMHHSSLESNGAAKSFPTGGVNPGSGTTTCGASPYFDISMQEIPEPKGNASRCARTGMLCRRRGARKHSPSYPYVSGTIFSEIPDERGPTPNTSTLADHFSLEETRSCLFTVGVIILELVFGQNIESCTFHKDYYGADNLPIDQTEISTARRWAKTVLGECGADIDDVVRRCLDCSVGPKPSFTDVRFKEAVYEGVIKPSVDYSKVLPEVVSLS
ncbi:hypothetical protein PENPOL_c011G09138 [Penicillium polonicum]|uniref:Uncharacterized protein n=1 Tax=Penicillium polonicum TaxID=60169 RepID=A0A1V6NDU8_PENPO|nr:hypothetical protein PENPOL_c011G09138 [Penicillium polonicum]